MKLVDNWIGVTIKIMSKDKVVEVVEVVEDVEDKKKEFPSWERDKKVLDTAFGKMFNK